MTETKLLAYHDDPAIKAKYMAIVEGHRLADEIVQDYGYWEDGKGCAVGCTLHSDRHQDYETELGIPEVLAWLEDAIFEGMPVVASRRWPGRFLAAPEPGADLSLVWPRFAVWMLRSDDLGLPRIAGRGGKSSIAQVVALHLRTIQGDHPSPEEWSAAVLAAESAEGSAEGTGSRLAALSAGLSAAVSAPTSSSRMDGWRAARHAAGTVARAAQWGNLGSSEWSVAWSGAHVKMADRLLALMSEAPIVAH